MYVQQDYGLAYLCGLFDHWWLYKDQRAIEMKKSFPVYLDYACKNTERSNTLRHLMVAKSISHAADGQFRAKWRDKYAFNMLKTMMPNSR